MVVGEHLAGGFGPGLEERPVQLAQHRSLDAQMRFPPVLGVLGVTGPHVGDPDSAGEADGAVDQEDAPVHAVVELVQGVPAGRPVGGDVHAGPAQPILMLAVQLRRAVAVEEQVHGHPRSRPLGKGGAEAIGGRTRPVDVGREFDGARRLGDGVDHGVEGGAVAHDLHPVAGTLSCSGHGLDEMGELRGPRLGRPEQVEAFAGRPLVLDQVACEKSTKAQPDTAGDRSEAIRHCRSLALTAVLVKARPDRPGRKVGSTRERPSLLRKRRGER